MIRNLLLTAMQYAAFSVAILYLYQGIINYIVLKHSVVSHKPIRQHIGLCLFSALYSFLVFLQLTKISVELNEHFLHLLWMSGSLVTYFYITSIKAYLKDESSKLNRIKILPLISTAGAAFAYLSWIMFDRSFFVDQSQPFLNSKNIYMAQVGGFNPSIYVKGLSLLVMIPTVYSAFYFLRYIYKNFRWSQKFLAFGIAIDLFAIFNDVSIALYDPELYVPIIFLANLIEILRITYDNQNQMGKQYSDLTQNYIQTSKLSEAGTYYAYLAHEIFNPLSAAIVYFERLTNEFVQPTETATRYITAIKRQHEKIMGLAKNVKRYTKLSLEGQQKAELLMPLVQDALDTINIRAYDKNVQIKYTPTHSDIKIKCLGDQITQVVTNFINNSIEAVSELDERWVHIDHMSCPSGKVIIIIRDSGRGIPREIQDKIFDNRFTTKKESGLGLGLAICHRIIENHGGSVRLNASSPNTEFLIELPIYG